MFDIAWMGIVIIEKGRDDFAGFTIPIGGRDLFETDTSRMGNCIMALQKGGLIEGGRERGCRPLSHPTQRNKRFSLFPFPHLSHKAFDEVLATCTVISVWISLNLVLHSGQ